MDLFYNLILVEIQCWSEPGLVSPAVSPSPQGQSPSSSIESVLTTPNLTLELSTIGLLKKTSFFLVVLRPPRKKNVFFLVVLR